MKFWLRFGWLILITPLLWADDVSKTTTTITATVTPVVAINNIFGVGMRPIIFPSPVVSLGAVTSPDFDFFQELFLLPQYNQWLTRLNTLVNLSDEQIAKAEILGDEFAQKITWIAAPAVPRARFWNNWGYQLVALATSAQLEFRQKLETLLTTEQLHQFKETVLRDHLSATIWPAELTPAQWQTVHAQVSDYLASNSIPSALMTNLYRTVKDSLTPEQRAQITQSQHLLGDSPIEPVFQYYWDNSWFRSPSQDGLSTTPVLRRLAALRLSVKLTPDQHNQIINAFEKVLGEVRADSYSIAAWKKLNAKFAEQFRQCLTPAQLARLESLWENYAVRRWKREGLRLSQAPEALTLKTFTDLTHAQFHEPANCPADFDNLYARTQRQYTATTPLQPTMLTQYVNSYTFYGALNWSADQRTQLVTLAQEILTNGTPTALRWAVMRNRTLTVFTPEQRQRLIDGLTRHACHYLFWLYTPAKLTIDQQHAVENIAREMCTDLEACYQVATNMDVDEQYRYDIHSELVPRLFTMTRIILTPEQRDIMDRNNPQMPINPRMPIKP